MRDPEEKIEFLSTGFSNAAGILVCVLSAGIGLLFRFAETVPDDGHDSLRYHSLGALFALGALLFLYRKKIIVFRDGPSMEIKQGIWPFMRTRPATLALADTVKVSRFSTQQGSRGYNVFLKYSDGRRLRLLRTLDFRELSKVARLSELIGAKVEITGSLNDSPDDPVWDAMGGLGRPERI